MRYLPPQRWHEVTPGTVIMDHNGIARRVLANDPRPTPGHRTVLVEGLPPAVVRDYQIIAVVELDESDAIVNMLHAGLTVQPIKES